MHAALTLPPMRVSALTLQTRLPLYPDEPLFAYVARLAIAAGHHTLSGFIAQTVGDHVSMAGVFSGAALQDVAQLVDADPRHFEASTFVRGHVGVWHHPRARLPASALSFRTIRWCPQCAQEGARRGSSHISLLWTLAAVRGCPKHDCRLVERRWRHNAIDEWARCPVGAVTEGADSLATRVTSADPRDLALATFLQSRLGFGVAINEPPPLRPLPLDAALAALKVFGRLARARFERPWAADGTDEANGFELLQSAPLADLLDELTFGFAHRIALPRPREVYGDALCDFVGSNADDSDGGIKAILRRHAAQNLRADDRAGSFATDLFARGRLDVSELGGLLQVSTDRIIDVRTAIAGRSGKRAPVGPIGAPERAVLTEFALQTLDKTTFAGMLGVSVAQLEALKDLGLAEPYGDAAAMRPVYLRPQITLVLAQLGVPSAPLLRRPPRDGILLTKASSLGGELFERCCRALAAGTLRPVGVTGHHRLDEVVVSLADLQALRPADTVAGEQLQLGLTTADDADGAMLGGLAQVAAVLGCSEETAGELVERAGVGRRMALRRRGSTRPLFGREEIAALHDAWVSLHELDRRLPQNRAGLLERLAAIPRLAGSTSQFPFFDRAAAEAVLWPEAEGDT